jgi:hypothetical protein
VLIWRQNDALRDPYFHALTYNRTFFTPLGGILQRVFAIDIRQVAYLLRSKLADIKVTLRKHDLVKID